MTEEGPRAEYTVRDFSAVEKQIQQIADRENVVTQRLRIANYKQICLLGAASLVALGLFLVLAGIAYRIAFPPEKTEIIETTKVVEKIVQPPETNIVIQAPAGSLIGANRTDSNEIRSENGSVTIDEPNNPSGTTELSGQQAADAIQDMNERLIDEGVMPSTAGIQASLSWDNFNDLDLMIREPNGNLVWFKKKKAVSGGVLDIDANARPENRTSSPIENITWQSGTASPGKYDLLVMFYARDKRQPPTGSTNFTVKLKIGDEERVFTGRFKNSPNQQRRLIKAFTVGNKN